MHAPSLHEGYKIKVLGQKNHMARLIFGRDPDSDEEVKRTTKVCPLKEEIQEVMLRSRSKSGSRSSSPASLEEAVTGAVEEAEATPPRMVREESASPVEEGDSDLEVKVKEVTQERKIVLMGSDSEEEADHERIVRIRSATPPMMTPAAAGDLEVTKLTSNQKEEDIEVVYEKLQLQNPLVDLMKVVPTKIPLQRKPDPPEEETHITVEVAEVTSESEAEMEIDNPYKVIVRLRVNAQGHRSAPRMVKKFCVVPTKKEAVCFIDSAS